MFDLASHQKPRRRTAVSGSASPNSKPRATACGPASTLSASPVNEHDRPRRDRVHHPLAMALS